jgi:thioredoxin 1
MDEDAELDAIRGKKREELRMRAARGTGGGVIILEEQTFEQALAAHPRLVVDFWAEWCGPCRMVGPVIEDLAGEFAGRITFGKCDTDQNQRLAAGFGISAIPTILLFHDGKLVDRIVGAYPKESIRGRVLRAFGSEGD